MLDVSVRKWLIKQSYEKIQEYLEQKDSIELIDYLNSHSAKIAGTAIGVLIRRTDFRNVVNEILANDLLTDRLSKICFLNGVYVFGKKNPDAIKAALHFLHDKNKEVASQALFGIVFYNDPKYIPTVKECRDTSCSPGTDAYHDFSLALRALEEGTHLCIRLIFTMSIRYGSECRILLPGKFDRSFACETRLPHISPRRMAEDLSSIPAEDQFPARSG